MDYFDGFLCGFLAAYASPLKNFFLFRGNTLVEVNRPLNPNSTFYKFRDNTRKEMIDQFIGGVSGCAALIEIIGKNNNKLRDGPLENLWGGGGRKYKKKIRARENLMKKNS